MPSTPQVVHVHNAACETAALASCHCFCHGAGHQNDLVVRAAGCSTTADRAALAANLETILGGFHASFRDVATRTRGARKVLDPADAASIGHQVGRGATWFETLIVDETLHAMFLRVADGSLKSTAAEQLARKSFVEKTTSGAIGIVGSKVSLTNIAESHVWCAIVAEYLSTLASLPPGEKLPAVFDDICYPRLTTGRRPKSLPAVQSAGLAHLSAASSASTLPPSVELELLRLVGAATCPDIWHHPAVARFCLQPFVTDSTWPPKGTSKIVTPLQFNQLVRRWSRKHHW
ncbi:hypothetical protein [Curtobacterium aurantiacum]|uniref:hypothetical protein n=1 Tax=Curtobacterium aurantiacum TaxID=3236919 RepID=UPI001BDE3048|nr:hypothetical protein [Curtobacterium flaccumfaciens]MBT1680985.1 hypothetical protein [Curtobacterium flaccumfaciens pv. flaccumfaciens]